MHDKKIPSFKSRFLVRFQIPRKNFHRKLFAAPMIKVESASGEQTIGIV